jgi:hypothetical protein
MRLAYAPSTLSLVSGGSFNWQWAADVYYQNQRVFAGLPLVGPSFTDDGTAKVQSTGSATVRYSGLFADSIAPRMAGDLLAPFGSELAVYVIVFAGGQAVERIEMGWYRIVQNPSIQDRTTNLLGQQITVGSEVKLTLQDRMHRVQRDEFDMPTSPASLTSVMAEVQRLSGLQVTTTVADKPIPNSVAYQQSKLDAVYDLVDVLDALPYMRPDGTLGQRPNVWPAQSAVIRAGRGGTLQEAQPTLSNDKVYNRVAVLSAGGTEQRVLATAMVTSGPLRAQNPDGTPSPYGQVTYRLSSPFVTTEAQATAYAQTWLPRVSSLRAGVRQVTEIFNPLREVGDVVAVQPTVKADWFQGRVLGIRRSDKSTQDLTLEVSG